MDGVWWTAVGVACDGRAGAVAAALSSAGGGAAGADPNSCAAPSRPPSSASLAAALRCARCAASDADASNRLCELNVIEQVANVCQTTIARDAWERGQELAVHGWIYGLADGHLQDLQTSIKDGAELNDAIALAIAGVWSRYALQ